MWRYLLLVGLLLVGCGMGPTLYAGDKMEERACRWCAGSGEDQPLEGQPGAGGKCPGCRGAGKLQVIVPGPQHPAVVRGTVRDASVVGPTDPDSLAMQAFEESHNPGPVRGAVPNARIVFQGAKTVEYTVPSSGRIRTLLEPGHYSVTVTAPGFQETRAELDVAPRREPIWQEKARLKTPEGEADTTYVDFALTR